MNIFQEELNRRLPKLDEAVDNFKNIKGYVNKYLSA